MTRRSITWILCIAAIALACGPHARRGDGDAHASVPNAHQPESHGPVDTSLATSAKVAVTASDVSFALQVTNLAPHSVELNFPSGQTHEFVVVDTLGREIWRSSTGKMFTQSVQNREVDANATLSFRDHWEPRGYHGKYTALAKLRSSNHPVEERVDFVLP
jgi:hypothetical protein